MKLKLPVILSADDYHAFTGYLDVIESVSDFSEYGVPTKKLPAIAYVEVGFADSGYIGVFYSPLVMGKKLDLEKDNKEIVAFSTNFFIQDYADKAKNLNVTKLKEFVHNQIEVLFENEKNKILVDSLLDKWVSEKGLNVEPTPVVKSKGPKP